MYKLATHFFYLALITFLSAFSAFVGAANHNKVIPALAPGAFPVACSNLAHDENAMNQIGGPAEDFWEGNPQNGQLRYLTQILAEPQAAIQFGLKVPDDRGLYNHFANDTLPFVSLVCYPTSLANTRADYRLPDGQVIPRMERSGDAPIFPDSATRYPLVVYSHGMGGSPVKEYYLDTLLRLASHGYIVMAIFHGDARVVRLRIENLADAFYLLRNFDRYFELQSLRPLALKRALDDLLSRPGYGAQINTSQIGGLGTSLGGQALLLSMGAHLTRSLSTLASRPVEQDSRIKAAVGYAPYFGVRPLPAFGNDQAGADFVTRPYMAIAGSADTTAPLQITQQAVNRFKGTRYLVVLDGIEHTYEPEYADDVFTWAITFLDAHVKDDRSALSRLVKMQAVAAGLNDTLSIDYTTPTPLAAQEALISEHFYAPLQQYFDAANDAERAFADPAAGWTFTGDAFKALTTPKSNMNISSQPVCRFFGVAPLKPTLFYSENQAECDYLRANDHNWRDLGTAFHAWLPDAAGDCADGLIGVYRLYNNGWQPPRYEPNHRYTTSVSGVADMVRNGWTNEGMRFCVPL